MANGGPINKTLAMLDRARTLRDSVYRMNLRDADIGMTPSSDKAYRAAQELVDALFAIVDELQPEEK